MATLRSTTHDSGPGWIATPFLYDSFIHYSTPVYPGALRTLLGLSVGGHRPAPIDTRSAISRARAVAGAVKGSRAVAYYRRSVRTKVGNRRRRAWREGNRPR